jgi:hypothetical protein
MIFKRAAAKLRAQDWTAILIELGIVVLGVFIGTWVASRNQEAIERDSTIRLLNQFKTEIHFQAKQYQGVKEYMAVTGAYARTAEAGWRRDPAVNDRDFVVAAYQASQITGTAINTQSWASMFGAGQVQNVQDPAVRTRLIRVLSLDSSIIDVHQLESDYRKDVRSVIPGTIQEAIRARCGDIFPDTGAITSKLPARCDLLISAQDASETAAALRMRPELAHELDWHRATVASMMSQYGAYIRSLESLSQAIDHSAIKARGP